MREVRIELGAEAFICLEKTKLSTRVAFFAAVYLKKNMIARSHGASKFEISTVGPSVIYCPLHQCHRNELYADFKGSVIT